MTNRVLLVLFLMISLSSKSLLANDIFTPKIIQKADTSNGMVNSVITSFQSDDRFRLWIGTASGLYLYDGQNAAPILGLNNQLKDVYINTLLIDSDVLFIGTTIGLFTLNLDSLELNEVDALQEYVLTALAIKEKTLFIGTLSKGLFEYELDTQVLHPIDFSKYAKSPQISMLQVAPDESLWVAVYATDTKDGFLTGGLFQLINKQVETTLFTDNVVISNGVQNGEYLYLAAGNKGIKQVSLHTKKEIITKYPVGKGNVRGVAVDQNGCIWTSEMGGVGKLCDNTFRFFEKSTSFLSALDASDYLSVFYDKNTHIVWLGGYNTGARGIYVPLDNSTRYALPSSQNAHSLSSDEIYAIATSKDNHLWIGYNGQGIDIVDKHFKKIKNITVDDSFPRANHVISMLHIVDDEILVGTFGAGLWLSRDGGDSFSRFINTESESVNRSVVTGIAFDATQKLYWIATIRELYKVDQNGELVDSLPYTEFNNNALIYDVEIVNRDNIILATGAGAVIVNSKDLSFQYPEQYAPDVERCHGSIVDFATTTKGEIIFVNDTYCMLNPSSLSLNAIDIDEHTEVAGLSIIVDSDGRWVSAGSHLNVLTQDNTLHVIDKDKGLFAKGSPAFSGALVEFANHYVFATPVGIAAVNRDVQTIKELPTAEMFVNQLFINNEMQSPSLVSKGKFDIVPTKRFISMTLSIPEFYHRQFEFSLLNEEISVNALPLAQLNNFVLPTSTEGRQRSIIQAKNDGVIVDELAFEYDVLVPMWRQPQAILLYFALIILAFYIAYKYRIAASEKQRVLLQEEVKLRTKELTEALSNNEKMFENVSHELRTPLTIVLGTLGKLKRSNNIEHASLSIIERQSSRLLTLVESLLKHAEIKHLTPELENINISQSVNYHIECFSSLLEERGLIVNVNHTSQVINLRKGAFDLIMLNLLSNVCKYATQNTTITLTIDLNNDSTLILKMTNATSAKDGDAMKARFAKEATTTAVSTASTGLGLDIINALVKELKGDFTFKVEALTAVSEITLPVTIVIASLDNAIMPPTIDTSQQDTILLVEDNDELIRFICDLLKPQINVVPCGNGKAALDYLIDCKQLPSLILSDIVMPFMDGYALCKKVKEDSEFQSIPFVLMTAKGDQASIRKGYEVKADDYVIKPFDPEVLLAKLNNLLHTIKAVQERARQYLLTVNMESDDPFTKEVSYFLAQHFSSESISAEELALTLNISAKTLNRRLQKHFGSSFSYLLREYRLEVASTMLAQGKSAKEACFDSGFNSLSYFTQSFKAKFAMTPAKYRHSIKGLSNE